MRRSPHGVRPHPVRVGPSGRAIRAPRRHSAARVGRREADGVAALWAPDGVNDIDELFLAGRERIRGMVRSPAHQAWIRQGCAHVVGPPHITVVGDEAVAVCHSLTVVREAGRYIVRRATANHWRLRRTESGRQVVTRTNRILDGRPESPGLPARGVRGEPAGS
ncbi:nuclear transport factor 2 family protein [Streptomyces brevispora]|uniref:nuclear transport factor 2 family protein n=1 Tax=Streptomyces brevispora TaxID=887462 RepID=UPI002E31E7E7|nr:nuclear transport factor 2 family protein [Streptomyces brevispora]